MVTIVAAAGRRITSLLRAALGPRRRHTLVFTQVPPLRKFTTSRKSTIRLILRQLTACRSRSTLICPAATCTVSLSLHRHAQRRRSSTQRSMDCDADDRRDPSLRSSGHRCTVQRAQRSHPSLSSHPSPSSTNLHPSRRLWLTAHQTHQRRHPSLPLLQPTSLHPLPHPCPRRTVYSWSPHHRRPRPDPPSRQTSTACPWYTCNVFPPPVKRSRTLPNPPRPVKRSSTLPNPSRPVKRYSTSQLSAQGSRYSWSTPASSRTTCSARCCTPVSRSFSPPRTQWPLSQKEKKTKKIVRHSLLPGLRSLT